MDKNKTTKLQKVINILLEKGLTEAQVADFVQKLTTANFAKLYEEALLSFTKEDLAKIESTKDQQEADKIIAELYTLRTGKNAQQETQKFLDIFCDGFLAEYEKDKLKAT